MQSLFIWSTLAPKSKILPMTLDTSTYNFDTHLFLINTLPYTKYSFYVILSTFSSQLIVMSYNYHNIFIMTNVTLLSTKSPMTIIGYVNIYFGATKYIYIYIGT